MSTTNWRNMLLLLAAACLITAGCKEQEVGGETETEVDLIENEAAEIAAAEQAVEELEEEAAEKGIIADGAAAAEPGVLFVAWDLDKNQQLTAEEFASGVGKTEESNYFVVWDVDKNEQLSQDELADGLFATWDTDDDELIDEEEYTTATGDWWGDAWTYGDYTAWNTDTTNPLNPEEFRAGFAKSDIFVTWQAPDDKNDYLTNDEFSAGLFGTWDDDDSGYLDRNEFVFEGEV